MKKEKSCKVCGAKDLYKTYRLCTPCFKIYSRDKMRARSHEYKDLVKKERKSIKVETRPNMYQELDLWNINGDAIYC